MKKIKLEISDRAKEIINRTVCSCSDKYIKITTVTGGCAGFVYKIQVATKADEDILIGSGEYSFLTDEKSLPYLEDIKIDVKNGLDESLVVWNNAAKLRCKCGSSFS